MRVPFVDLQAQYQSLKLEIDAAIAAVLEESAFIGGRFVLEFERAFAADYGVKHCIPVANGTDAIYIALKMLGIGTGDEVITTAHSWISTSEAISQTGARPVFVDVDDYFTIDAQLIEAAITPRTRAILPVHLYGQAADMGRIMALAAKHRLLVVEDCAQAHYAEWQGRRIGTFGNVATFSFYPGKNLGAYGDAGAIVTNDDALAQKMRMYANHGALKKHQHVMEGVNSRLDGIQAAILRAKLPHVHEWTRARRVVAGWYDELLGEIDGIEIPRVRAGGTHVYHLYVIKTNDRDVLSAALAAEGIDTAVHYPAALPALEPYRTLHDAQRVAPRAVENSGQILSLPIYAEHTKAGVEYVADAIARFKRRVR
jgi:dTDP-4-amino-4,6-dideoxygalactose transaminase